MDIQNRFTILSLGLLALTASPFAQARWQAETHSTAVMQTPIENLTGYIHTHQAVPPSAFKAVAIPPDLPWEFDWRDSPGGLTPIKNQGSCGSCWAFGTTAALEQALKIKTGQDTILSEQELVSCSGYGSCMGGSFAHGYQQKTGQSLASEYPYSGFTFGCKRGLSHQYKIKSWGYVGAANRTASVDEIKAAILQYGAVAVTVYADSNMQRYKSGIFDTCHTGTTNHIVALVGWNDQDQVWYLRNSWGATWGEQGYMRIKWNCNNVAEETTYVELE